MLVHHFLESSAKRLPDKVALICDDQRLTYREINSSADQLAAALVNMGVRRQDRIVIFLDNSAESVISLFGILKAGAIFIMLNPTMKSKKLNYILNDSGACVLITQSTKSRIVSEATRDVPELKTIIWLGKSDQLPKESPSSITFYLWKEALSGLPAPCSLLSAPCIDLDLAIIIYTSFRIHRRPQRRNVGPL